MQHQLETKADKPDARTLPLLPTGKPLVSTQLQLEDFGEDDL